MCVNYTIFCRQFKRQYNFNTNLDVLPYFQLYHILIFTQKKFYLLIFTQKKDAKYYDRARHKELFTSFNI